MKNFPLLFRASGPSSRRDASLVARVLPQGGDDAGRSMRGEGEEALDGGKVAGREQGSGRDAPEEEWFEAVEGGTEVGAVERRNGGTAWIAASPSRDCSPTAASGEE